MRVREALAAAAIDVREARLLLAEVAGAPVARIAASPDEDVPFEVEDAFLALAARRRSGEPVAYLLGRKEFYGLDLIVSPQVLVPRPETELLVDLALERRPASVLDLGTGSGAIALAIKRHRPGCRVLATDVSAPALDVAKRNAVRLGLDIEFREGALYAPLGGERFSLVVSNPPYVAEGDPHLPALRFEPRGALVGGLDGLEVIRALVAGAQAHLLPGGELLIEHGRGQEDPVCAMLNAAGFRDVRSWPDLAGIARVSGGRLES